MELLRGASITDKKEEKDKILDITHVVSSPQHCPHCNEMMKGPFTKYKKRETELYFDLERKYEHCELCGIDVEVVDFQVLIEKISSMLPPEQARSFSMKNNRLFEILPEKSVSLLFTILDDAQREIVLPVDTLVCVESLSCNRNVDCYCSKCIHKMYSHPK